MCSSIVKEPPHGDGSHAVARACVQSLQACTTAAAACELCLWPSPHMWVNCEGATPWRTPHMLQYLAGMHGAACELCLWVWWGCQSIVCVPLICCSTHNHISTFLISAWHVSSMSWAGTLTINVHTRSQPMSTAHMLQLCMWIASMLELQHVSNTPMAPSQTTYTHGASPSLAILLMFCSMRVLQHVNYFFWQVWFICPSGWPVLQRLSHCGAV